MSMLIMIIDDDEDDRFFFVEAVGLINPSYECIEIHRGDEALEYLKSMEELPHYIFLDLVMPGINGKEVLRELKDYEKTKDTPVVIYSSSSYQKDIDECKVLGAKTFITKPPILSLLPEEIKLALAV